MWFMLKSTPSTCSQEQGGASLEICCSDTSLLEQLKSKNTRGKSSSHGRRTVSYQPFPSGMMFRPSELTMRIVESTSSASSQSETGSVLVEDSPAKISPLLERALGSRERGRDYGRRCAESLAKYDQGTSSWRTPQLSLLEDLSEFLETLPRYGMTLRGELYQLPMLERGIRESASGDVELPRSGTGREMHIPTPCCLDAGGGYRDNPRSCVDHEGRTFRGVSLAYLVNHPELYWNREKFPTPISHDRLGATTPESLVRKDGKTRMDQLATYVKYRDNYPSPIARDYKGTHGSKSLARDDGNFETRIQTLPNFVDYILEGNEPTDTGDFDKAMERIENERRKHGRVQLADTDSE